MTKTTFGEFLREMMRRGADVRGILYDFPASGNDRDVREVLLYQGGDTVASKVLKDRSVLSRDTFTTKPSFLGTYYYFEVRMLERSLSSNRMIVRLYEPSEVDHRRRLERTTGVPADYGQNNAPKIPKRLRR